MGKRPRVKWAEYEELAHKIVSELMPFADVKLDDHLHGQYSETARQIDVSARWKHDDEDMLLIVQVKDLARRADVNTVGAFRAVVEDVGAQKGVLICSMGFSDAAIRYARNRGISLYSLLDAQSKHWPSELTIPIIWSRFLPILSASYTFRAKESGATTVPTNGRSFVMRRRGTEERIDVSDIFSPQWNSGQLAKTLGVRREIRIDDELDGLFIYEDGREDWLELEDVEISYRVTCESWLGQLAPVDYRGLSDHLSDQVFVPSHVRFEALPDQPDEKWKKISDPDKVALSIKGMLMTAEQAEVDPNSMQTTSVSIIDLGE